jgi:hypothetical protein
MRTIVVWIGAVLMAGGLAVPSVVNQGFADEPPATGGSSEMTEVDGGKGTAGSEAASPVVEGEPVSPPEAGDVQERGLLQGAFPGVPKGNLAAPGIRFNAPTPSLTVVANALILKMKSLTTVLTAPPNLPVTVPVEISVGYYPSAGNQRITQNYAVGTGNRVLYNDLEGDGNTRRLRLDITLRELQPGGPSFAISWPVDLDPLYDVSIGSLRFLLLSTCDLVGDSEIKLIWHSPDDQLHYSSFSVSPPHEGIHIPAFAWSQREVSTHRNFHEPNMVFYERDPSFGDFAPNPATSTIKLLPGKTQNFVYYLNERSAGPTIPPINLYNHAKCWAQVTYNITRSLLTYPHL